MNRFRVRSASQTYQDNGPDLLRPKSNAAQQFARSMGSARTGWYTRVNPAGEDTGWTDWKGPVNRAETLQRVSAALSRSPGAKFQAGRVNSGAVKMRAEFLVVLIPHVDLPGVKAGAELVADLNRAQWGGKLNIGGFACREYNGIPGSGWSDHAWGDAVDLVPQSGLSNDKLTDWNVRMARAGCMGDVQQFIGSRSGRVYSFVTPSYAPDLGGPPSHLTHCHCSYVQHFGRDPNCR